MTMNWDAHFTNLSRQASFSGDFTGASFGIGVIDLLPPKPPPPPPPPTSRESDVGAEVSAPIDPHAAALAQRDSDRKKLVMVGMGAGALLLLAGLLSGPSSPAAAAAPSAPRPVVNVRFDKYFGGKKKK